MEAEEHRAILAAAAGGDADRAAGLLATHIGSFAARRFPGWGTMIPTGGDGEP